MQAPWFAPLVIGAAILGWLCALLFGEVVWLGDLTRMLQTAFLSALKMIIAPMIFFSLLTGIMQLRQAGSVGRLGGVTIAYYFFTSAIAIGIGLTVVFIFHPWTAYPPLQELPDMELDLISADQGGLTDLSTNLITSLLSNPFAALAETNILGILFAAILIGLAAANHLPKDSKWPEMLNELTQVVFTIARWVIATMPLGLFAIAFQMTERIDVTTLISLGYFAGIVIGATLFHGLFVLPAIAWLMTGTKPWHLLRNIYQPMLTALLTSSSAATLPVSLNTAENRLQVDPPKAAFVLPLGATINMDGTALFEGIAVVFLAYMFNVPLDGASIVIIFFVAMLASAGAPGIPTGSMAGLQTVLLAVGIPLEAIALLLIIERPLDTIRTAVNVQGDLVGSMVVNKWA